MSALFAACSGAVRAVEPRAVQVPSLDAPHGAPVVLPGHWFPAAPAPAAAVVLLHGCGGAYDRRGRLSERMTDYAARLNAQGLHALVVDSLTPRGEREVCTQRDRDRRVTPALRRLDALGAAAWLAARPEVDRARIGLLGWSQGGSTVLAATDLRDPAFAAAPVRPAFAVAFYPGCARALATGWQTTLPLLMLVGSADDWTPAAPCRALASTRSAITYVEFDGAHHGFDGTQPVRLRTDVPGGARPGQGVHVGGDAAARDAALRRLDDFLRGVAAQR